MGNPNAVYNLGDMVWAKVSSFPPWPAMVYLAPNDEGYVKEPSGSQKGKFHVQFFGPMVERAWSFASRLVPYKGKAEFDFDLDEVKHGNNRTKKEFYNLKMNPKLQTAWEQSWQEAELALTLDPNDRVCRFGRIYVSTNVKSKKSVSPNKTSSSSKSEKPAKSRKSESQSVTSEVLTVEEEQVGLENFIESEKAPLMEETPDIDPEVIEENIKDRWARMDIQRKRRYILSDYGEANNGSSKISESKVSGRKIKPSNKTLDQYSRRSSQGNSNIWRKGIKRHSGTFSETEDGVSATPPPNKKSKIHDSSSPQKSPTRKSSSIVEIPDDQVNFEIQRLVSSPGEFKIQPVCPICEIHSDYMLQCHGGCYRHFHIECVRNKFQNSTDCKTSSFECPACFYGHQECILCNSRSSDNNELITCPESKCGRMYHQSCISSFPHALHDKGKLVKCPAHYCISCMNEKSACKEAERGNLITCIKCPLAFHAGDICMAAGSIERSLSQVVCPRHFAKSLLVTNKPVVMTCCFACKKQVIADKVVCCECPGTFHLECLEMNSSGNTEEYRCTLCSNMQPIRYSQIVWAKVSHYRWWPCEVIHPRNAPMNILKIAHPDGAFPVHFFGAQEYQWISRQRVIVYEQGLALNLDKQTSKTANKMSKMFNNGMDIVSKAHRLYVAYVSRRLPLTSMSAEPMNEKELMSSIEVKPVKKATGFKFTKQSVFTKDELKFPEVPVSHLPVCSCSSDQSHPCSIGPNSNCTNVINRVECHPETCPAAGKCENQVFTKRAFHVLGVFETKNRGHGLRAMSKISQGSFVVDYVGEIIDRSEMQERLKSARKSGVQDLYVMRLDDLRMIDAGPCGNLSRYINHSCNPNLTVQKWNVNNETRVGFFAIREIAHEEELTFNYSNLMINDDLQLCLCGSNICQGYLGSEQVIPGRKSILSTKKSHQQHQASTDQPLIAASQNKSLPVITKNLPVATKILPVKKKGRLSVSESKSVESFDSTQTKKSQLSSYYLHENICFRCLDGGELVLCDKKSCSKSYHLGCLGLCKPPTGIWHCPWHHCDDCGLTSTQFCSECPNSYCDEHMDQTKIYKHNGDKIVCSDHCPDTHPETQDSDSDNAQSGEPSAADEEEENCHESHSSRLKAESEDNQSNGNVEEVEDCQMSTSAEDKDNVEDHDIKVNEDLENEEDTEQALDNDERETSSHHDGDEDIDDGDIIHEDEPDVTNEDSMMNCSYTNNDTTSAVSNSRTEPEEEQELVEEVDIDSHPATSEPDHEIEMQEAADSLDGEKLDETPSNQEESNFTGMF